MMKSSKGKKMYKKKQTLKKDIKRLNRLIKKIYLEKVRK